MVDRIGERMRSHLTEMCVSVLRCRPRIFTRGLGQRDSHGRMQRKRDVR
jgi:hypothetical protein